MGQGGYLWIVNATTKTLKLTGEHCYQMNSWNFSDINANSKKRFYIEFEENIFHTHTDDAGEANFQVETTDTAFQLQVRWLQDVGRFLQVNWKSINTSQFIVFPPPSPNSTIGKLGWIHDGSLCMLIKEKTMLPSLPAELPELKTATKPAVVTDHDRNVLEDQARDVLASLTAVPPANISGEAVAAMTHKMASIYSPSSTPLALQWMKYYSDVLGKLTLTGMTLPGTHDSGTYDPVSVIGKQWIQTQNLSLLDQLNRGIRVLDLRIGQNSPGDYIISHDKWRTEYSLSQALQEVKDFISATDKEIVILDFHRFNQIGDQSFDYDQLKRQVKSSLNGYYLPVSQGQGKTLSEIWKTSGQGRIVVAWNSKTRDSSYMWPGVDQHWYFDADRKDKLKSDLEKDFTSPPSKTEMWSTCVFVTPSWNRTPRSNAEDLCPTIDNWFYGCSDWTLKANIISTDFFDLYNNTVQASICASIIKT